MTFQASKFSTGRVIGFSPITSTFLCQQGIINTGSSKGNTSKYSVPKLLSYFSFCTYNRFNYPISFPLFSRVFIVNFSLGIFKSYYLQLGGIYSLDKFSIYYVKSCISVSTTAISLGKSFKSLTSRGIILIRNYYSTTGSKMTRPIKGQVFPRRK